MNEGARRAAEPWRRRTEKAEDTDTPRRMCRRRGIVRRRTQPRRSGAKPWPSNARQSQTRRRRQPWNL